MPTHLPAVDRRAQLVDAAIIVATREGLAATTVRTVAREADVSLGVVHYCFTDKDELLAAMAEAIARDLADAGADALPLRGDLGSVLRAGVAGMWHVVEHSAARQLLTYEITIAALRNPRLYYAAVSQYRVSVAMAREFLEFAAETAGITWQAPVAELADMVLAQVDGVALRWLVDRDAAAARAQLERFVALLMTQAGRP